VRAALGFIDRLPAALPDWYLLKLWASDVRDREQKKRIQAYDRDPLRAALEVYRAGRRLEPRLGRRTFPALVIQGGKARVGPPSNVRELERRLGSTRLETRVYPNSAHLVAVDVDRDAVAEDVAAFVARL